MYECFVYDGPKGGEYLTVDHPYFECYVDQPLEFRRVDYVPFDQPTFKRVSYKLHKYAMQRFVCLMGLGIQSFSEVQFRWTFYVASSNPHGIPDDAPEEAIKGLNLELVPKGDLFGDFEEWFFEKRLKYGMLNEYEKEILYYAIGKNKLFEI